MKNKLLLITVLLFLLLGGGAWWFLGGKQTVTIANIANLQSQLRPLNEAAEDGSLQEEGGAAYLRTAVQQMRTRHPELLLTASGDMVLGLWWRMWGGEPEFNFLEMIKADVAILGNHEFDLGLPHLKSALEKYAKTPIVATNIRFADPSLNKLVKRTLLLTDANGVKVGFFSLASPSLVYLTRSGGDIAIDSDTKAVARQAVSELRGQGADVVVLLSHSSLEEDLRMAAEIGGLSLVICGESMRGRHSGLIWVDNAEGGKTPVLTCEEHGRAFSAVTLALRHGRPVVEETITHTIEVTPTLKKDEAVEAMLEPFETQLDNKLREPIGSFAIDVDAQKNTVRTNEAPLGDFLADVIRYRTGSAIAVVTSGGIRGDRIFPAGPVSVKTIMDILPFPDRIVIKEMTGREIRQMLELSASALIGAGDDFDAKNRISSGGFMQVSGLKVEIALGPVNRPALVDNDGNILFNGNRIKAVTVTAPDGAWLPLNDSEIYSVAMADFTAAGGDKYRFLANIPARETGLLNTELVIDHIKSREGRPLELEADGRIQLEYFSDAIGSF